MAKPDAEHKDMAGNTIKPGDILAFSASTYYSSRLGFGRVTRITPKRVTVSEAKFGGQWSGETLIKDSWYIVEDRSVKPENTLRITMHSLPKEVFDLLDNLELT